ncbi:MAG: MoxR family ATPase [Planctomycetes bacterium]|nr:MoxR family ATPase [Planctomycetota bacterium]
MQAFQAGCEKIAAQVRRTIVGQQDVIEQVMTCLLCGGHGLVEGVPGLGKTLLVQSLARALDLSFSRIQFTPDLMPADITGTNIVVESPAGRKFEFQPGPVFANVVLADEINRATPKTQSALLEAMQEQTVSVARTTHRLPGPFMVLATQNPLEMEGTYPLPEAQLDRFFFKILIYPPAAGELAEILDRTTGADQALPSAVASADEILRLRQTVRQVAVAAHVKDFIARLALSTGPGGPQAPPEVKKYVRYGSSPRGAQAVALAAKARALAQGRANVAFDDVHAVACPALRHRIILNFDGQADGIIPDDLINKTIQSVVKTQTM